MQRRGESGQPVKRRRAKLRKAPNAHVSMADLQEELERRTRERDEALEQQTAISEILRVISNSPSDVNPVLNRLRSTPRASVRRKSPTYPRRKWRDADRRYRRRHGPLDR